MALKRFFLCCVLFYGFAGFGSAVSNKEDQPSVTVSGEGQKAVSVDNTDKKPAPEKASPSANILALEKESASAESTSKPLSTQPLTYYEALEKYRETARLEWKWGLGFSVSTRAGYADFIHSPFLIEFQKPLFAWDERFKGLLQAGGMYIRNTQKDFNYLFFPLQAGLKYGFSPPCYVSLRGGLLFPSGDSVLLPPWTGAFTLGCENDILTMDVALQRLLTFRGGGVAWELVFSVGGVLKKWWAER